MCEIRQKLRVEFHYGVDASALLARGTILSQALFKSEIWESVKFQRYLGWRDVERGLRNLWYQNAFIGHDDYLGVVEEEFRRKRRIRT